MLSRRITAENSIADLLSRVFYKQFVKKKKKDLNLDLQILTTYISSVFAIMSN